MRRFEALDKAYVLAKAAINPARGRVMAKKLLKRLTDRESPERRQGNLAWIRHHCRDFADEATGLDRDLWQEALEKGARLKVEARAKLAATGVEMGGGGFYPMLYFLTRLRNPLVIVETGVAAGFSSRVFLEALEANGRGGRLYSSDFPYFRLKEPEKFIGLLVDEPLRRNWELYIDGDEKNLPAILAKVESVDLFHYDSDKSVSGRAFALRCVLPTMAEGGLIVMDDIQDNAFFKDLATTRPVGSFRVYEFEGKYIGVLDT